MTSRSLLIALMLTAFLFCDVSAQTEHSPSRDSQSIEILTRAIQASGDPKVLARIHNVTEKGEITFYWGKDVKGPVSIEMSGGNHFHMEAQLPEGRRVWFVTSGVGTITQINGKPHPLSYDNAINLENLTFPIFYCIAALTDLKTNVAIVGIEEREGRSVYRLQVKGSLGLSGNNSDSGLPAVKDLLIDALNFRIVSVEDRPFRTYQTGEDTSDKPSRSIEFEDFRNVDGVLVPFSVTTKLLGQKTLSISLSTVLLNGNADTRNSQN